MTNSKPSIYPSKKPNLKHLKIPRQFFRVRNSKLAIETYLKALSIKLRFCLKPFPNRADFFSFFRYPNFVLDTKNTLHSIAFKQNQKNKNSIHPLRFCDATIERHTHRQSHPHSDQIYETSFKIPNLVFVQFGKRSENFKIKNTLRKENFRGIFILMLFFYKINWFEGICSLREKITKQTNMYFCVSSFFLKSKI